jgi:hypothetical protein
MSAFGRWSGISARSTASAPNCCARSRARPRVRLAMTMLETPGLDQVPVTSSMVSPAPTSNALQSPRLVKMRRATSTAAKATDTGFSPIAVSVRTFLAMEKTRGNRRPSSLPTVPGVAGHGVGGLELAEDLRLAEDHGIEARRDRAPCGAAPARPRGGRRPRAARRRQVVVVGHPVDELRALSATGVPRGHDGVELRAVAGGEHHDLVDVPVLQAVVHRLGHLLRGKGHALAHLDCAEL